MRRAAGFFALSMLSCGAPNLTFVDEMPAAGPSGAGGNGGSSSASTGTGGDPGDASMGGSHVTVDGSLVEREPSSDAGELDVASTEAGGVSCTNQTVDGEESDVDCGGRSCPRCGIGAVCRQDTDCIGAYCNQGICAQGSCVDRVKNLKETDVDCGGGDCPPCGVGASCISYTDCVQQSCVVGRCQSLSCDDRLMGPGETDVDCGGPACAACAIGKHCLLPRDCASAICTSQFCVAATCSDGVRNGTETGKDCGGPCAPCVDGMECMTGTDCASGVCSARACQAPSCTDKVKNQGETDVDCGGPCNRCGTGSTCVRDLDCLSSNCAGTCQPCPKDMVNVPTTAGGSYCIDANEVTIAGYAGFLAANPSVDLFPPACNGKSSFAPSAPLDMSRPTYPVTYVDWCQAYAYCFMMDRHLCGRVGGGAALGMSDQFDAAKSEWHNACTRGGTQAYPYGMTYVLGSCVDNRGGGPSFPRPVGSATACVGGYAGLHDMSGNVQEWEDNCLAGTVPSLLDNCKTRGGGYNDGQTGVACGAPSSMRRRSQSDSATGFRCCR